MGINLLGNHDNDLKQQLKACQKQQQQEQKPSAKNRGVVVNNEGRVGAAAVALAVLVEIGLAWNPALCRDNNGDNDSNATISPYCSICTGEVSITPQAI